MTTWRLPATAVTLGVAVLALVALAARVLHVSTGEFTRDPAALAPGLPFYGGSVSILSAVVWGVAGALCLFVAWTTPAYRRALVLLGTLALLLLADDVLMVHDDLGPRVGIPDEAFYVVYAVLAALCVGALRGRLRRGPGAALLLGGALLGLSVAIDTLDREGDLWFLAEDGAKLLGGLVWITVPVLAYTAARVAMTTEPLDAAPPPEPGPDASAQRPRNLSISRRSRLVGRPVPLSRDATGATNSRGGGGGVLST